MCKYRSEFVDHKPSKYKQGKIYKLVNDLTDEIIYVGSTIQTLHKRMYGHTSSVKTKPQPVHNHINEYIGIENVSINLIANYPCNTKKQLTAEEGKHIKMIGIDNLYNCGIPGRTQEEYYIQNKNKIIKDVLTYQKNNKDKKKIIVSKYQNANRDKIHIQKNTKHICTCGGKYTPANKASHTKTKKHLNYLNTL